MILQPAIGLADVVVVNLFQQGVKSRAVIKMDEMRHFMRDHRTSHEIWGLNQPPVEPDARPVRTTAPAPLRRDSATGTGSSAAAVV